MIIEDSDSEQISPGLLITTWYSLVTPLCLSILIHILCLSLSPLPNGSSLLRHVSVIVLEIFVFSSSSKNSRKNSDWLSLSFSPPLRHFQAAGQNHILENVYFMHINVNLGNEVFRKV